MADENLEDERDIELASIAAIFPELSIDPHNSHKATLELQVSPSFPIAFIFEPAPEPTYAERHFNSSTHAVQLDTPAAPAFQSASDAHVLSHLPPLQLQIDLPDRYPDDEAPKFHLSTTPQWLQAEELKRLTDEGRQLWEEYGHSLVVYAYIDFLQQEAERCFGLMDRSNHVFAHSLKTDLLSHDRRVKKELFEKETFECGVCLEPKKGSACYRLRHCGHVFCVGCLQDFFNAAITEGDVGSVKCLTPNCGVEHLNAEQRRKAKPRSLHPAELLDIPLEEPQVRRYANLKLKKKLESDKSTVYCPRDWCQGPAKSAKYAKYDTWNLEEYPESDSEDEAGGPLAMPNTNIATTSASYSTRAPPPDRLSICSVCAFAFCRICQRSWHGDHINCLPRSTSEMTAEEQASYDYIRLHTSPCPTCMSPCQKTHGCNHMRCFQCKSHFCYLCSSWLSPDNPYNHFNQPGKECYMRLWELEEGDEGQHDHAGGQFVGPRAAEAAAEAHLAAAQAFQAEELAAANADAHAIGAGNGAIVGNRVVPDGDQHVDVVMNHLQNGMQALRAHDRPRAELAEMDQVFGLLQDARRRRGLIPDGREMREVPGINEQLRNIDARLRVQELALLRQMQNLGGV